MLGLQIRLSSAYTSVDIHVRGFQGANPEQRECAVLCSTQSWYAAQHSNTAPPNRRNLRHHIITRFQKILLSCGARLSFDPRVDGDPHQVVCVGVPAFQWAATSLSYLEGLKARNSSSSVATCSSSRRCTVIFGARLLTVRTGVLACWRRQANTNKLSRSVM